MSLISSEKGSRKYQAQLLSAIVLLTVALVMILAIAWGPNGAALAGAAGVIMGAVALGLTGKDASHAWGDAKEHAEASKVEMAKVEKGG